MKNRKHDQKINHTHALAMTRDMLVGLFARGDHPGALKAFDQIVSKTRDYHQTQQKKSKKTPTKNTLLYKSQTFMKLKKLNDIDFLIPVFSKGLL